MSKPRRQGRVATGGHSTNIADLKRLASRMSSWPEIKAIMLGPLNGGAGRRGGFKFEARGWAYNGPVLVGVSCVATFEGVSQQVLITSPNPPRLRQRLVREGFSPGW